MLLSLRSSPPPSLPSLLVQSHLVRKCVIGTGGANGGRVREKVDGLGHNTIRHVGRLNINWSIGGCCAKVSNRAAFACHHALLCLTNDLKVSFGVVKVCGVKVDRRAVVFVEANDDHRVCRD